MKPINKKKCGFTVIVGAPNSGKSTLTNYITGVKVSIVSPKAQTTRSRITGIKISGNTQIILVDTPGIFNIRDSNNKLNKAIVQTAKNSIEGTDFVIFLVDASKPFKSNDELVLNHIKNMETRKLLVLNKVDKADKIKLLELTQKINSECEFEKTFMISALKGSGVNDIEKYLEENLPDKEWEFPEDQISDAPVKFLAAEITREKLFYNLNEELPYSLYVETEKFEEKKDIKIHQTIHTDSESHKGIIVGKQGSMIKKIGEQSRKELQNILGKKIHLFLFVKVTENWYDRKEPYLVSHIEH